ncbi:hypothetical protein HPG69_014332 [Diceros bicornis minor]|uniref:Uncharacterized protein n=1 Tax=Diceros bicornis minor TaxID=77932 RepID=A0A7J7EWY5_DICBM|nr:hypothetical protein HPG69_014332 [Diceros bicornis minor]
MTYDLYGGEKFATLAIIQYYLEHHEQLTESNGDAIKLGRKSKTWQLPCAKEQEQKSSPGILFFQSSLMIIKSRATMANSSDPCHDSLLELKYVVDGNEQFNYLMNFEKHYQEDPIVETSGSELQFKRELNKKLGKKSETLKYRSPNFSSAEKRAPDEKTKTKIEMKTSCPLLMPGLSYMMIIPTSLVQIILHKYYNA